MAAAPITDQGTINFSTRARLAAAQLYSAYQTALELNQEWLANNYENTVPNDPTAIVQDGAPANGQHELTGAGLNNLMAIEQGFIAQMQANSDFDLNWLAQLTNAPGLF